MAIAGQRIAVNICYEDLFGHVIRRAWSDPAHTPTMMLNLSNLAWFEDSIALPQHLQISRLRALETQHPMLRATNTGATAVVDAWGRVVALDGTVQGHHGRTPYIRYGNAPALVIGVIVLLFAAAVARAGRRRSAQ
jgi:apolipoprotein N-acyltransferase